MSKKLFMILSMIFCIVFSGCSCNKEELIDANKVLFEENNKLNNQVEIYDGVEEIFDFYNNITTENVDSFVLVESKNVITGNTKYSNGVVVARNGYYHYVLTDYFALTQNGVISYRVMDSKAVVYDVSLANDYDEETGLILLIVVTSGHSNVSMKTISLGDVDNLIGHISSINQFNKVQIYTQIKTSTIMYEDTSYNVYNLENVNSENGSSLINSKNKLCGIYLSKINSFIGIELIKEVVYSTYSLVL